jgi:hypothetical protein
VTRLARLFLLWIVFGLGPVLILFVITAIMDSFSTALSVVTESESPYCIGNDCKSAGIEADLLAIGGYLLVPVLIGTLSAVVFDVRRRRDYVTKDEFDQRWAEHAAQLPPPQNK